MLKFLRLLDGFYNNILEQEMLVAAHQPLFIPWIGYFDKICKVDKFVIVDNVQFTTSGWIRKNSIKTPSGVQNITVSIRQKKNLGVLIKDVLIDTNDFRWKTNHLKAFQFNYGRAKYYNTIMPAVTELYSDECKYLSEFNVKILRYIINIMKIGTEILMGSEIGIVGHKTDLIIDICQKTHADSFMLGMGGSNVYADQQKIASAGIKIVPQNFIHPIYDQLWGPFVSHLCILDLLFNKGAEARQYFAKNRQDDLSS